jgi:hypothetical protein
MLKMDDRVWFCERTRLARTLGFMSTGETRGWTVCRHDMHDNIKEPMWAEDTGPQHYAVNTLEEKRASTPTGGLGACRTG